MIQVVPVSIVEGLSSSGGCVLTLGDPESSKRLPILIGAHEARSLLMAKNNSPTKRPTTHQLMKQVMETYGLSLVSVSIDRVEEGVFFATLHLSDGFNGREIDSRATDAVTLALLFDVPINVAEQVMEECGVSEPPTSQPSDDSLESLMEELARCEENEDYERAAEIQLKIDQMKSQSTK